VIHVTNMPQAPPIHVVRPSLLPETARP
jgi:hypothetical protein